MNAQPPDNPVLHPYVAYIKHRLEALLRYVDLESDGEVVQPTAIRLRRPERWATERWPSLLDALGPLSGYCNAHCDFCYEVGNPLPCERTMLSLDEARTRVACYNAASGRGILQLTTRLSLEPFLNPHLLELLALIRRHSPSELISLTTNGAFLTPDVLDRLAALQPVCLVISVNSADARRRRDLMHDPHAAVALQALPLLRERAIPFVGSVVAWPTLSAEELQATIRFIDGFQPRRIRVGLPGYSRFFSEQTLFDTHATWQALCAQLEALRPQLASPLLILPNLYAGLPLVPRIDGVVPNSPAQHAGVRYGDMVRAVDGQPVRTRRQARALLEQAEATAHAAQIELERDGCALSITLREADDPQTDLYPYKPLGWQAPYHYPSAQGPMGFGALLNEDVEIASIARLVEIVARSGAHRVLLLTTEIMGPIVATALDSIPDLNSSLAGVELHMVVPRHRFWGGNIMMGDLYMVSDYYHAACEFIANTGDPPDLIVLPSSFATEFGRDLLGVPYLEIERRLDIPVELVPCPRILT